MTLWEQQLELWEPWTIEARKTMLDRKLSTKALAEAINVSPGTVTAALCGYPRSASIVEKISKYLGIAC